MSGMFQITGLASGLDTKSMIEQIMAIERQGLTRIQSKIDLVQQRRDALRDVGNRLANLQNVVARLSGRAELNAKSASASNSAVLAAAAGTEAANGTFQVVVKQLATPTTATSNRLLGSAIGASVRLDQAGFGTAPTSGSFTINGVEISVDVTTDSLTAVKDRINSQLATAAVDITASIQVDAEGRANVLQLTPGAGVSVQLGSGGDTSNFLSVAKVLGVAPDASGIVRSQGNLGAVLTATDLKDARLQVAPTIGGGSFEINGVEISWKDTEFLNAIISRINASGAGVTAAYDPIQDRFTLTSGKTGTETIDLRDLDGSNFLYAVGLATAEGVEDLSAQEAGQNAVFTIDTVNGGADLSSASNTVAGLVPGVTLTLKQVSTDPVSVTVSQNMDATVKVVQDFVAQYNSAMDLIRQKTAYDPVLKRGAILMGDVGVQRIEVRLRSLVAQRALGVSGKYSSLAELGVTTGAIGSPVGTTDKLVLDEAKLRAALLDDPAAVERVFNAFSSTAVLQAGGSGSIASITGAPTGHHQSGSYAVSSDEAGNLSSVFTPEGGTPQKAVAGAILAGGANSSLIPGMTLTAKATLVAGTDTIQVTVSTRGVALALNDYLKDVLSDSGVFEIREGASETQLADLRDQMARFEDRLAAREETLNRQFAALESALARLESQSQGLLAQLAQLETSS